MKKKTLCCVLFFVALLLAALTGCADLNVNFVIAFESNGGTPCEEIRSQDAASIRIPDDPVRENYVFAGWYWDDGVWEEPFTINSLLDVPVSERMEIVVYAKWEGAEYNVVLKVGEEEMRTVTVRYGEPYSLPIPERTGETFAAWCCRDGEEEVVLTDEEGNSLKNYLFSGDAEVYAKWKTGGVLLSFDSCGGNAVNGKKVWQGETFGTLPLPVRTGYAFDGWYTEAEGGEKIVGNDTVEFTDDAVLYAHWTPNRYTVSFDGNGAISGEMEDLSLTYGTEQALPANDYLKTGYHFVAWTAAGADGEEERYSDGETVLNLATEGKIVLTAQWEPNAYSVRFDGNGATSGAMKDQPMLYDRAEDLNENAFLKKGYTFEGWRYGDITYRDGAEALNLTAEKDAVLVFKAIWEPIRYTVYFDGNAADGGDMRQDAFTMTYDEPAVLPDCKFTRTGYRFVRWFYSGDDLIETHFADDGAEVINLTATAPEVWLIADWAPIEYIIAFDANGADSVNVQSVVAKYDEDIRLPTEGFEKSGYTLLCYTFGDEIFMNGAWVSSLTDKEETVTLQVQWLYDFSGSGTKEDPYLIDGKEAFLSVDELMLKCLYDGTACNLRMTADIDLEGATVQPFDRYGLRFSDVFDGNGHTVSDFCMNGDGETRFGLFGFNIGTICDLTISSAKVTLDSANAEAGVLVGRNEGRLLRCAVVDSELSFDGDAEYMSASCLGLLAGRLLQSSDTPQDYIVASCYTSGKICAEHGADSLRVGGLAGDATQTLFGCYSTAQIILGDVPEAFAGGLVGYLGIMGLQSGRLSQCFVAGGIDVRGAASGSAKAGDLAGGAYTDHGIESCYRSDVFSVFGAQASDTVNYAELAADSDLRSASWREEHLPAMCSCGWANTDGEYPRFGETTYPAAIEISSAEELAAYSGGRMVGNFVLTADISLAGTEWRPALLLGSFDGDGHTVSDLSIAVGADGAIGFFAVNYGSVTDLALKDVTVQATVYSSVTGGMIAAVSYGPVTRCVVTGSAEVSAKAGTAMFGGIVGILNNATIAMCHCDVALDIEAAGSVVVNGIVGKLSGGAVEQCYSLGELRASGTSGGVCGIASSANLSFSLCDIVTSESVRAERSTVNASSCLTGQIAFGAKTQKVNGQVLTILTTQQQKYIRTAAIFVQAEFQEEELFLGQFVSEEDLAQNPANAWIVQDGALPILYYEA